MRLLADGQDQSPDVRLEVEKRPPQVAAALKAVTVWMPKLHQAAAVMLADRSIGPPRSEFSSVAYRLCEKRPDVSAVCKVGKVAYLGMIARWHHPERPITSDGGKHGFRLGGRRGSVLFPADDQYGTTILRQRRQR